MKYLKTIGFFILVFLPMFSYAQTGYGDTVWAKSTVSGSSVSKFEAVTTDNNGNYYGAGYIWGNGAFGFGNGVTISGPNTGSNTLLVKYDSSGNAIWAKSMVSGANSTCLYDVATDGSGNVYVAGYIAFNGTYDLGNGITVSGSAPSSYNIFVAKYDMNGNALWAKSTSSGPSTSQLYTIAVDSSGDVYVAGEMETTGTFGFDDGVTAAGSSAGDNLILIKYDTNGTTKWAKTVSGSTDISYIYGVALDNYDSLYTAGMIDKGQTFNLGNNVTVAGVYPGYNIFLAKYNSTGSAEWATTAASASGYSTFKGLALDNEGNILAGGYVQGPKTYGFGNGVNATVPYSGTSALLLKYNNTGDAQWVKFPTAATGNSEFEGTALDSMGNVYAVGYAEGTGQFDFGNNVTVNGVDGGKNLVLVNYDCSGNTLQAKNVVNGTDGSTFLGATINNSTGDIYTGGCIEGDKTFDLGNNVAVNGVYSPGVNALIVKYHGNYTDSSSHQSSSSSISSSKQTAASSSSSSNTNVASDVSSITHKLPKLFAVGGAILLLF